MSAAIILMAAWMTIAAVPLTAQATPTVRQPSSPWMAPRHAASRINPLANDADAAGGGEKLFRQRCSVCHGADAQGTSVAPSLTSTRVQRQSDGELFWKISTGNARTGMPTFSFLPPSQRWQLVLHLRRSSGNGHPDSERPGNPRPRSRS